jgi:hypothetical protein
MIKLTYQTVCDICHKECHVESFDCTNYLGVAFPRPTTLHTYQLDGALEMCDECAAPIAQAKHDVIQAAIRARGNT